MGKKKMAMKKGGKPVKLKGGGTGMMAKKKQAVKKRGGGSMAKKKQVMKKRGGGMMKKK